MWQLIKLFSLIKLNFWSCITFTWCFSSISRFASARGGICHAKRESKGWKGVLGEITERVHSQEVRVYLCWIFLSDMIQSSLQDTANTYWGDDTALQFSPLSSVSACCCNERCLFICLIESLHIVLKPCWLVSALVCGGLCGSCRSRRQLCLPEKYWQLWGKPEPQERHFGPREPTNRKWTRTLAHLPKKYCLEMCLNLCLLHYFF